MKIVQFEGISQAARILSCVQPYIKNSEDMWVNVIKGSVIEDYNRTGRFTTGLSCAGYTLIRCENLDDFILYEVFVSPIMIDQFVLNDFQAKPYSYNGLNYYETIEI